MSTFLFTVIVRLNLLGVQGDVRNFPLKIRFSFFSLLMTPGRSTEYGD